MIYENKDDRNNQTAAFEVVNKFFKGLPLHGLEMNETPESRHLSHDFEIWWYDKFIAVGEIKCRNYDAAFFTGNGWMIARERIVNLLSKFKGKSIVLVLRTSDGKVMGVTIDTLIENASKILRGDENMAKDNHGASSSDETPVIIPWSLLTHYGDVT